MNCISTCVVITWLSIIYIISRIINPSCSSLYYSIKIVYDYPKGLKDLCEPFKKNLKYIIYTGIAIITKNIILLYYLYITKITPMGL
jgi:hypothetical protein